MPTDGIPKTARGARHGFTSIGTLWKAFAARRRKRASTADAFAAQKELLAEAQQIANVGSWEYDLTSGRRIWSDHMAQMYGFRPGAPPDIEAIYAMIHPDDRERVRAMEREAHALRKPFAVQFRIVLADGALHTLLSRGRYIVDADGRPRKIVGIVQDITETVAREDELARRALQHAVVANLGQIALSGASLAFLFEQVTSYVCDVLELEFCEILQKTNGHLTLVAGCGWQAGVIGSTKVSCGTGSQAAFTLDSGFPVTVHNVDDETRFQPSELLARHGIVSGITVAIGSGERAAWGVLGAHSRARRTFTTNDTDFLRSVATVLSQAIERHRVDAELRSRAAQQSAIAELGRAAVTSFDAATLQLACELVERGLSVERAAFSAVTDSGTLQLRAGHAWTETLPRELPINGESQSGLAVLTGRTVVVDDYAVETRFRTARAVAEARIASGVVVPVASAHQTFGVLSALARTPRRFRDADVHFMESMAITLAEAMERERGRRALVESEDRYRNVVEGASDIIFTIDADGVIVALNRAFETVTGWPREQWIGRTFQYLVGEDERDRICDVFETMFVTRERVEIETSVIGKNKTVLLEVTSFPRIGEHGVTGVYGFARDVTEARRAERERRNLELKLEQAQRLSSLGRLAATVAHEFNNVLMGIAPFIDIIRRRPERAPSALEQMARSVERGKRITGEILRYTQPSEPTLVPIRVQPWLQNLVTEARSMLSPAYTLDVRVEPESLRMRGDATQLHQALTNIVLNARDAMPAGGAITIRAAREAPEATFGFGSVARPEHYVHFTIQDRGCGIAPEMLPNIFEPLYTTKRSGTGLGLAVTHQVVQQHRGEIFAESVLDAGTTFHVFIPVAEEETAVATPDADAEAARPRPAPTPAEGAPRMHLLLVEDDPTVSSGLVALLTMLDIDIDAVATGRAAIEWLGHSRPDAVILDVGLPDMDGVAVYTAIGQMHPGLPVIFSTGHADRARLDGLATDGRIWHLLKPYDSDTLLDMVAKAIGR